MFGFFAFSSAFGLISALFLCLQQKKDSSRKKNAEKEKSEVFPTLLSGEM